MNRSNTILRKAAPDDTEAIWKIFQEIVSEGTAFVFLPETTREEFENLWFAPKTTAFVACIDGEVAGSYIIKPNHPGRGAHVANAAYMVASAFQGQGIGRAMAEHSLQAAREQGFLAMQFNIVISTNEAAVRLWQKMGFQIACTLPKVFRHPNLGLVDAYVMHRFL